jgi:hypothetical protein
MPPFCLALSFGMFFAESNGGKNEQAASAAAPPADI